MDAIYVALAFLVPGFVFSAVRNQFITGQEQQGTEQFIRFLTYSAVNYALFSAPIYFFLNSQLTALWKGLLWTSVILVGPAFLGLLSGIVTRNGWVRKVFHWTGLNPVHAVPTAWDYKFSGMKGGEWVLVTLKNGTRFAGFCGSNSFASSDNKERDLFIEKIFDLDENDKWIPTEKSVFIAAGEIGTIEFWPVNQEMQNEQQVAGTPLQSDITQERLPAPTDFNQLSEQPPRRASADNNGPGHSIESAESRVEREPKEIAS